MSEWLHKQPPPLKPSLLGGSLKNTLEGGRGCKAWGDAVLPPTNPPPPPNKAIMITTNKKKQNSK